MLQREVHSKGEKKSRNIYRITFIAKALYKEQMT